MTPDAGHVPTSVDAAAPALQRRVIGDVRVNGKPEPFVTVRLGTAGTVRSVVADEGGHFELADVSPGAYAIAANAHGMAAFGGVDVGIDPGQPRTVEVTLTLEPAAPIAGVVRDAAGQPLPGALVRVEEQERALPVEVETRADGRFNVEGRIRDRTYRVTVRRAGYLPDGPRAARAGGTPLDVRMRQGATLDGLVVDESGAPVANADVAVVGDTLGEDSLVSATPLPVPSGTSGWSKLQSGGELGVLGGPIPFPPAVAAPIASAPASTPRSDAAGHFHLAELPGGRVIVTARHPDFAGAASVPIELVAGQARTVRIELSHGARLVGRVLDDRGLGLADAQVTTNDGRTVVSDSGGRFTIEHMAGKVTLSVRRDGWLRGQGAVDIGHGQREAALDVTLRRALGHLGGDVTDGSGRGVVGARLSIIANGEHEPSKTTTDGNGHFLVEGMPDGPYRVVVEHGDFAKLTLPAVEASTDAHLVMHLGGGVEGELFDPRLGHPPPDAKLEWVSGDERRTLPLNGRSFRVTGLPSGPARLIASAHGYPRLLRTLEIGEATRPDEVTARDVRMEMELGGKVAGRVRDDRGEPVAGVEVRVTAPSDANDAVHTDSDGRFLLDGVPSGSVTLTLRRGEQTREEKLEVRSNEESRADVVLPASR